MGKKRYTGPRVNTAPYRANVLGGRQSDAGYETDFRSRLGQQTDRSLWSALGYKEELEYDDFDTRYERGPGIAKAIVDKPVNDAWGEPPEIIEPETGENLTEFEEAVKRFMDGEATRQRPIARMQKADRDSRIGSFALIVIGATPGDGGGPSEGSFATPLDADSLDGLENVHYLSTFSEDAIEWDDIEFVEDFTNPRFNLPETYEIDLGGDRDAITVHHSRVIHVPGENSDDDLRSDSVLKNIWNRLDDVEKILGASGEAFWRSAYQGLHIRPPEVNGQLAEFEGGSEEIAQRINGYLNNWNRIIATSAEIETLDAEPSDPLPHLEAQYRDISAAADMPQSIIMGNETGERATEQDRVMWHEYVSDRQRLYCESFILRPLIDRLIDLGALPPPTEDEGEDLGDEALSFAHGYNYEVVWPELGEPTEKEQAETNLAMAKAWSKATGGAPDLAYTIPEMRVKFGDDPTRGAEAPEDVQEPADPLAESVMATTPEEDGVTDRSGSESSDDRATDGSVEVSANEYPVDLGSGEDADDASHEP